MRYFSHSQRIFLASKKYIRFDKINLNGQFALFLSAIMTSQHRFVTTATDAPRSFTQWRHITIRYDSELGIDMEVSSTERIMSYEINSK